MMMMMFKFAKYYEVGSGPFYMLTVDHRHK